MFFHLLFIHTFRPFLKYNPSTSPLPANVSPRKLCTQAASMISKLLRLYKRSHGLRQICNIAVYIAHSACTIHLLNLPEKNASRDIVHGLKHLEEIAEGWLCARRTLAILSKLSSKWNIELPIEAQTVLERTDRKFGPYSGGDTSPQAMGHAEQVSSETNTQQPAGQQVPSPATVIDHASYFYPNGSALLENTRRTNSGASLPPHSAQDLQHPPRQTNHGSTVSGSSVQPRGSLDSTSGLTTSMASPTDMFGGIEQLMREGQDWALRDQQNLAMGFENWGTVDWTDLSWMSGANNGTGVLPGMANGTVYGPGAAETNLAMNNLGADGTNDMTMMHGMNGLNGGNGGNGGNGVNGMNWARTHGFIDNESDWYN